MAQTMLEAHVHVDTSVTIHSVPIPSISEPNDVLVRVICASCNPKDWKMQAGLLKTIANCPNAGDDIAGIVHEVGSAVTSCKPGDRVAALHELGAPHGAYAEFALVKDFVCLQLPDSKVLGFEEAATYPMAVYMSSIALFGSLEICAGPWDRVREKTPLLIYGAATAVGCMAVQLARVVGIHPLICVAGGSGEHVAGLIDKSKGDVVLDYRAGGDAVVEGIRSALGGQELLYAIDVATSSLDIIAKVLKPQGGKLALTLPGQAHTVSEGLEVFHVMAGSLWKKLDGLNKDEQLGNLGLTAEGPEFARKITSSIEKLLHDGVLESHPHVVYDGGLNGLEAALKALMEGRVRASRAVVRVVDTPGSQTVGRTDGT